MLKKCASFLFLLLLVKQTNSFVLAHCSPIFGLFLPHIRTCEFIEIYLLAVTKHSCALPLWYPRLPDRLQDSKGAYLIVSDQLTYFKELPLWLYKCRVKKVVNTVRLC